MPKYVVSNKSNQFDIVNTQEFADEASADAAARQVLQATPTAVVSVMQVLKEYSAKVSITSKEPSTPVAPTEEPTPQA